MIITKKSGSCGINSTGGIMVRHRREGRFTRKELEMEICVGIASVIWVVSVIIVIVLAKRAPEGEEIEGVGFVRKASHTKQRS